MPRKLRRVYIDFDDILSETALAFTEVLERHFGKRVEFENIFSFNLEHSFGLSPEDTAELMRLIHEPAALRAMRPVAGAAAGLEAWRKAGCEICVVTGRPPFTFEASSRWIRENGMPVDRLIFVDKYGRRHAAHSTGRSISLARLKRMRFSLAVEDSPVMIDYIRREMPVPMIILDRPWNRREKAAGGIAPIARCMNWAEIIERFPEGIWK